MVYANLALIIGDTRKEKKNATQTVQVQPIKPLVSFERKK